MVLIIVPTGTLMIPLLTKFYRKLKARNMAGGQRSLVERERREGGREAGGRGWGRKGHLSETWRGHDSEAW